MTVTKLAISLKPELAMRLKEDACARGETVSGWIAEAIATRLRHQHLKQWVADYESEFGEITEDELEEVRLQWPV